MDAVILSIRPEYCNLIISGKKTIDIRKTVPKIETPFKCYFYETKETRGKLKDVINYMYDYGKVICEFVCDKVYDITTPADYFNEYLFFAHHGKSPEDSQDLDANKLLKETCLSMDEISDYSHKKMVYGLHISDLKVYDKPKELDDFFHRECIDDSHCDTCPSCVSLGYPYGDECSTDGYRRVTRPPQSWCYVLSLAEESV